LRKDCGAKYGEFEKFGGDFRVREPKGGERVVSEFRKVRERRRSVRIMDGG